MYCWSLFRVLWLPRCASHALVTILLCCAVLCCAVLCCAVLCCAVLCCAVLCCAVLYCVVLCCMLCNAQDMATSSAELWCSGECVCSSLPLLSYQSLLEIGKYMLGTTTQLSFAPLSVLYDTCTTHAQETWKESDTYACMHPRHN